MSDEEEATLKCSFSYQKGEQSTSTSRRVCMYFRFRLWLVGVKVGHMEEERMKIDKITYLICKFSQEKLSLFGTEK